MRRAAASFLVLVLVGLFLAGDVGSPEFVLAEPIAHKGRSDDVTVYGKITGGDAPYRVVALRFHCWKGIVLDGSTTTAVDGTYSVTINRRRGLEWIWVISASGREFAVQPIILHPRVDYELDGRMRYRLRLWLAPIFGY